MTPLESKLQDILYLIDCTLQEDTSRNYGNRDMFLHKVFVAWEDFIELHPSSDDPYLVSLSNRIKILEETDADCRK